MLANKNVHSNISDIKYAIAKIKEVMTILEQENKELKKVLAETKTQKKDFKYYEHIYKIK